jgi:hypothetical protein
MQRNNSHENREISILMTSKLKVPSKLSRMNNPEGKNLNEDTVKQSVSTTCRAILNPNMTTNPIITSQEPLTKY